MGVSGRRKPDPRFAERAEQLVPLAAAYATAQAQIHEDVGRLEGISWLTPPICTRIRRYTTVAASGLAMARLPMKELTEKQHLKIVKIIVQEMQKWGAQGEGARGGSESAEHELIEFSELISQRPLATMDDFAEFVGTWILFKALDGKRFSEKEARFGLAVGISCAQEFVNWWW